MIFFPSLRRNDEKLEKFLNEAGNMTFLLSGIRWFSCISWCFVKWIMVLPLY